MILRRFHDALKRSVNRDTVCFSGLQFFYWAGYCVLFGYLVPFLSDLGWQNTQIGMILSLTSLVSIIGQPLLGMLCDMKGTIKKVVILSMLISFAICCLLAAISTEFLPLAILLIVFAFFFQSIFPLHGSWVVQAKEIRPDIHFGISRSLGSIGYAVTAVLVGRIYNAYGFSHLFPLLALTIVLSVVFSFGAVDISPPKNHSKAVTLTDIGDLLKNKRFTVFLTLSTILFIAFKMSTFYIPTLFTEVGGTTADLGISYAVFGISEALVILVSDILIRKFKDTFLIMVSMVFFVLRIGLPSFATTPQLLIAIHWLQGLSYGLFLIASLFFINRVVAPNLINTAQSFSVAVYSGLSSVVAGVLGGYLIDNLGIYYIYRIGGGMAAAITLAFFIFVRKSEIAELSY